VSRDEAKRELLDKGTIDETDDPPAGAFGTENYAITRPPRRFAFKEILTGRALSIRNGNNL
jgi:hypothetical protein